MKNNEIQYFIYLTIKDYIKYYKNLNCISFNKLLKGNIKIK